MQADDWNMGSSSIQDSVPALEPPGPRLLRVHEALEAGGASRGAQSTPSWCTGPAGSELGCVLDVRSCLVDF